MRSPLVFGNFLIKKHIFIFFAVASFFSSTTLGADNYEPPRNPLGQPDIGGFWTNVSLTPLYRSRKLGDRLIFTAEEVKELEGRADIEEEEGLLPTDPDAPAEFRHKSKIEARPEFTAAGGAVGGYNRFWLDPGSRVMRVGGKPRTSILTTPNGRAPAQKDGSNPPLFTFSRRSAGGYIGYEVLSEGERCIIGFGRNGGPPMYANGFYNNNYQIVQSPDSVMILVEMIHDTRIVRLNSQHRNDGIRPWFGDSIGWWEGDTLVVETINLPKKQAFYGSWENLTVTERFTRVADNRLHYQFTIDDPERWDDPWGGEYEFSTLDGLVYEYACHEGNYALPGILKGLLNDAKSKK
jgi:hypothetical protein